MTEQAKKTWSNIGWGALIGAGAIVGGVPGGIGVYMARKNMQSANYAYAANKMAYTQQAEAYTNYSSVNNAAMNNDEASFNQNHGFI